MENFNYLCSQARIHLELLEKELGNSSSIAVSFVVNNLFLGREIFRFPSLWFRACMQSSNTEYPLLLFNNM